MSHIRERYLSPELVVRGRVSAITASGFKCTGGSDAFFAAMRTGAKDQLSDGETIYDTSTGGAIDAGSCEPFSLP